MKKIILYFSVFAFIIILNFSCIHKKQEFTVQNFTFTNNPESYIDSSGIRFMYDVKLKHFFKNSPKYHIYAELYDQNSQKVFNSTENNHIVISKSKANWDSAYNNLEFFIPFDKINLPVGEHNVNLKLRVTGKRTPDGFIFNKKIKIDKPEIFNYEEQKITVKSFDTEERKKEIRININFDFKFKSYRTIGLSDNKDLINCYLKTELYDKKTGDLIQYVSNNNPTVSKFDTNNQFDRQYNFSVSYKNLKLTAGKHDILCKVRLTNKNDEDFGVLHKMDFSFTLPQLYTVNLNMKGIHLINKKTYDSTSAIGRVFSKKNKNNGKGFPDVFWKISSGNEVKFKSVVLEDSYSGYTGETNFMIEDKEKLQLSVWDEDSKILLQNDLIGKMDIINKKGDFIYNFNRKKFGNAECTFDFIKTKYNPWNK